MKDLKESIYHCAVISAPAATFIVIGKLLIKNEPLISQKV